VRSQPRRRKSKEEEVQDGSGFMDVGNEKKVDKSRGEGRKAVFCRVYKQ